MIPTEPYRLNGRSLLAGNYRICMSSSRCPGSKDMNPYVVHFDLPPSIYSYVHVILT